MPEHPTKYKIGSRDWDVWEGPPPLIQFERQQAISRASVDGIQHMRLGRGSRGFDVVVTAYHPSLSLARAFAFNILANDLEIDPVIIIWENTNWFSAYNHKYQIADAQILDLRVVYRVLGPEFNYPIGGKVTMRYRLYPEELGNPAPGPVEPPE